MNLLLDTNILLFAIRDSSNQFISQFINPDSQELYTSLASLAEINSIALQNHWGERKLLKLENLLSQIQLIEITEILVDTYIQIDAFSQLRNPIFSQYTFATPRNMGKNDLWIAATAALLNLVLVTTDDDFDHLMPHFLQVKKIDSNKIKDLFY